MKSSKLLIESKNCFADYQVNMFVSEAIDRFIQGCWNKVYDYYSVSVSNKNIYIFGAGIYGRFLYQALSHLGYGNQIKAFVLNIPAHISSVYGIPVLNICQVSFDSCNDIVVVGVQNSKRLWCLRSCQ